MFLIEIGNNHHKIWTSLSKRLVKLINKLNDLLIEYLLFSQFVNRMIQPQLNRYKKEEIKTIGFWGILKQKKDIKS